jgi:hypothetical protein
MWVRTVALVLSCLPAVVFADFIPLDDAEMTAALTDQALVYPDAFKHSMHRGAHCMTEGGPAGATGGLRRANIAASGHEVICGPVMIWRETALFFGSSPKMAA